jgi:hypothetical protein
MRSINSHGTGTRAAAILMWSLAAGAVYFLLVAIAHQIDVKIPGLFIYFNIHSLAYQNLIISLLAFGWSCFFVLCFLLVRRGVVTPVSLLLVAGTVAVAVLCRINLTNEVRELAEGITRPYWVQAGALAAYLIWLTVFFVAAVARRKT